MTEATEHSETPRITMRQRWIEGGVIVAFWVCVLMLTFGRELFDTQFGHGIDTTELFSDGFELFVWMLITPAIFWLARWQPFDTDRWVRMLGIHLVIAVLISSVVNELGHAGYRYMSPESHAWKPIKAWLGLTFLNELAIYLAVLAAGFARNYFYRFQERERRAAQLEAQLAEARLEALRMQINPHFLFNTLHAISSMVEDRPTEVHRMVARLSELLRYALDSTATQEVPLEKEIDFLRRYLEIQQIRFEGRLATHIDVESGLSDALVPSLILQPIVENAIKHGASQTAEEVGTVWITAELDGTDLVLCVQDNGPGLDNGDSLDEDDEGIGLENTRARLENLYGDDSRLLVEPDEERGGLRVQIRIPYHTSGDVTTFEVTAE